MWYYPLLLALTSWSAVYFVIALPAVLLLVNFVIGNCFLSEELTRCHRSERQCVIHSEEKHRYRSSNSEIKDSMSTSTNGKTHVIRKSVLGTSCNVKQERELGRLCVVGILSLLMWEYVVYMYSYRSSNMYHVLCADRKDIISNFSVLFGFNHDNHISIINEKATCSPIDFIFTIVDHLPSWAMTDALHSLMHCRTEVLLFQSSWLMLVLMYLWCLVSTSQINLVVVGDQHKKEKNIKNTKKETQYSSLHDETSNVDDSMSYEQEELQELERTLRAKNIIYCSKCSSYIAAKDHHCYFIDNCIGAHNKYIYLCCLVITCLHLSFVIEQLFTWIINERSIVLHAGLMLAITADVLVICLVCFHLILLWRCCTTRQFVKTVYTSRRGYWCNFIQLVKGTWQPCEV